MPITDYGVCRSPIPAFAGMTGENFENRVLNIGGSNVSELLI